MILRSRIRSRGYDTVEWFSDAAYTQKVTGDVEAQGQTLYARRVANDYTIVFSANGGSGAPPSVGAKYDQTVSLPKQEPLRRGYTFQGWSADIYGDASVYAAGEEVRNLAGKTQGEKITLYAQWAANKYTVRFEKGADDAEGEMQVLQAQFGTSVPCRRKSKIRYRLRTIFPRRFRKFLRKEAEHGRSP